MEIAVDEDVCLCESSARVCKDCGGTHGLEVAMDDFHRVKVLQSTRCFRKLKGYLRNWGSKEQRKLSVQDEGG